MSFQLCGATGKNTAAVKCAIYPDKLQTIAIWGGDLTSSEYDTADHAKTALLADSKLPKTDANKLFMLPLRVNIENKKGTNTEQSFSNGVKIVALEGLPGYRFSYFTSMQLTQALRPFNNKVVTIVCQDIKQRAWGTFDGSNKFIGRQAILFFEGLDHPDDASAGGVGYFTVAFLDAIENYDNAVFVDCGFNFQTTLKTLLEVQAYESAASVSNVLTIGGKVDVANIGHPMDVFPDLKTTLFSTAADWTVTNLQTGAAVTITTLANGVLTLNSSAYSALASGDKLLVATIAANLLDAASIPGIEVIPFIHTKP